MNKLLRVNFLELFKSKFFYVLMAISAAVGTVLSILMQEFPDDMNMPEGTVRFDETNVLFFMPGLATMLIPFMAAATAALLLDAQYNQGVIRNKIISGHKRTEIFISGLVVSIAASVIYFVIYEACVLGVAIFIYDYDFNLKASLISLSVMLLMIITMGTVLSFVIGNMLRGGKMIVILLAVQYVLNFSLVMGMFKSYSKVLEILAKAFPQGMLLDFTYDTVPSLGESAVISVVIMIAMTAFGAFYFNKCDIK